MKKHRNRVVVSFINLTIQQNQSFFNFYAHGQGRSVTKFLIALNFSKKNLDGFYITLNLLDDNNNEF